MDDDRVTVADINNNSTAEDAGTPQRLLPTTMSKTVFVERICTHFEHDVLVHSSSETIKNKENKIQNFYFIL